MAGASAGLGLKLLEGASAGANVASSYTRASATRGQALYNAAMADLEAEDTRSTGNTSAARKVSQSDRRTGNIKTQIAGRGFSTGKGTASDLQDASDFVGRLDALTIRENTEKKVLAKRAEAGSYRMRASSISPGNEALGTLIGESGNLYKRWTNQDDQE
jgi:hypothetical protein